MKNWDKKAQERDEQLEALFSHASPRIRPKVSVEQSARDALHAEWQGMVARRKQRRLYWPLAAAASLIVAILVFKMPAGIVEPVTVATVDVVVGTAQKGIEDDPALTSIMPGQDVRTGHRITTRLDAGLALAWRDGSIVRIDEQTRASVSDDGQLVLDTGRVYVDAGSSDETVSRPLVILTPAGPVTHVGTQYMTSVDETATTVSVREGRVRLDGRSATLEAEAGEQVGIDRSGSSRRQSIPTHGELWAWTETTMTGFAADGRTVADFLEWVGKETGRVIRYASPEAEQLATGTQLHGQIDLKPMSALDAILQTSDLEYELEGNTLLIHRTADR